jgi:hypothetical protein
MTCIDLFLILLDINIMSGLDIPLADNGNKSQVVISYFNIRLLLLFFIKVYTLLIFKY